MAKVYNQEHLIFYGYILNEQVRGVIILLKCRLVTRFCESFFQCVEVIVNNGDTCCIKVPKNFDSNTGMLFLSEDS
jgi:hypothetical protein